MDQPLSASAYPGAEPTCCSTVFSPSPDWAKQTEDSTNVMWQVVHPSETQIPQLLSMVSFWISSLVARFKFTLKQEQIADLYYIFTIPNCWNVCQIYSNSNFQLSISQWSTCMFLIILFSCLSILRPAFHSTQAQKWPCGSGFCGTEIFPSYSKTKGFPCTWSHLVKFPLITLLSC